MLTVEQTLGLALLGLVVGCFGTLIGAGGGFLLAPILVLMYPKEQPETLTSISLIAVFFNALSGSVGYYRQRLIDVRAGLGFSAAAVPGAVLGAIVTTILPRTTFELILAVMLLIGAGLLLFKAPPRHAGHADEKPAGRWGPRVGHPSPLGEIIAAGVGFVSSLLGIGGGIIHVPAMVHLLRFPVHVAAATSHFVLAITAGAAIVTHGFNGSLTHGIHRALPIGLGAVIGAQIGARLAKKIEARLILKALALALVMAGLRIMWTGIHDLVRWRSAPPPPDKTTTRTDVPAAPTAGAPHQPDARSPGGSPPGAPAGGDGQGTPGSTPGG
jgi:uncharacterized membrane protein YfcA